MQDANFDHWLTSRGLDQQAWTDELLATLKKRYRSENPSPAVHRIIVDARGCSWPARAYRVGEVRS